MYIVHTFYLFLYCYYHIELRAVKGKCVHDVLCSPEPHPPDQDACWKALPTMQAF